LVRKPLDRQCQIAVQERHGDQQDQEAAEPGAEEDQFGEPIRELACRRREARHLGGAGCAGGALRGFGDVARDVIGGASQRDERRHEQELSQNEAAADREGAHQAVTEANDPPTLCGAPSWRVNVR